MPCQTPGQEVSGLGQQAVSRNPGAAVCVAISQPLTDAAGGGCIAYFPTGTPP